MNSIMPNEEFNEPLLLLRNEKISPKKATDRCSEVEMRSTGNTNSQPVDIENNTEKKNSKSRFMKSNLLN